MYLWRKTIVKYNKVRSGKGAESGRDIAKAPGTDSTVADNTLISCKNIHLSLQKIIFFSLEDHAVKTHPL